MWLRLKQTFVEKLVDYHFFCSSMQKCIQQPIVLEYSGRSKGHNLYHNIEDILLNPVRKSLFVVFSFFPLLFPDCVAKDSCF